MRTTGYQALQQGAALVDLTGRGKIRLTGEDQARLLHAMTTNHVNELKPGQGLYAFFLNAQGRVLADVNIWNMGDSFLLDTEPESAKTVYQHLDKFIIADDVALLDETEGTGTWYVDGPSASAVVESAGYPVPPEQYSSLEKNGVMVAKARGIFLYCPLAEKEAVAERLRLAGAVDASAEDFLIYRLEQHWPRHGVDFGDAQIPQETQQMQAIHFSKGCYLGQEIVERVRSRGHVNKQLVSLTIEGPNIPAAETKIFSNDKEVGEITSAVFSPTQNSVLAFGYVRTEAIRNHAPLIVGEVAAKIVEDGKGNV